MALKTFKPYTPARRNMTVSAFEGVDKKAKPERGLVETLKKHSGRNNYGHITVRHGKHIFNFTIRPKIGVHIQLITL